MSVDPDTIQDLNHHELLSEWYDVMSRQHAIEALREKAGKNEKKLKALIKPAIQMSADRDLILHELERRNLSLEQKNLWKPKFHQSRMN